MIISQRSSLSIKLNLTKQTNAQHYRKVNDHCRARLSHRPFHLKLWKMNIKETNYKKRNMQVSSVVADFACRNKKKDNITLK